MKTLNKILVFSLAAVAFASCDDLDTVNQDYYVTTDQKQAVLTRNPEMASAGVAGISSIMSTYKTVYDNHFDFGYPGVMIGLDLQTNDYVGPNSGYNWFNYWERFTSPTPSGTPAGMAWYHLYKQIYNCNSVAASIPQDTDDGLLKFYRAQALATRAFDYFVLAQLFQFNYALVPDAPCVPIVTDENSAEVAEKGAPRASVKEVYAQVMSDLNGAIELLEGTSVTREQVMDSKPKRMVSLGVAYGLRARVNLTMQKYAEAAADAQAAIADFSGRPYSKEEVSVPSFVSLNDASWMWGIAIAETDRVVTSGIVNFPSMMNTFAGGGYVEVGAWKWCDARLYAQIPKTDVRKGWFLDEDLTSPNLSAAQQAYINTFEDMPAYVNVKFGPYNGEVPASVQANDIMLMRVEEMHYIYAEALARSGQASTAKDYFQNFIRTYRNPSYTMTETTAEGVAEAIYQDKRVEFWGEGLAFFDLMRLDKGIDRTGSNWPPAATFIIPSYTQEKSGATYKNHAGVLIYCIPQGEINGNPAISNSDNNESLKAPSPEV